MVLCISVSQLAVSEIPKIKYDSDVRVTYAGNTVNLQYMTHENHYATVRKLSKSEMLILKTGEIKEIQSHENGSRLDNIKSFLRTMRNLRDLLNTNLTDPKKVRWVTLTFRDNITDDKVATNYFRVFAQKFERYCVRKGWEKPKHIAVKELQGRGAWHFHVFFIWENMDAPFIKNNDVMEKIWGNGWTNTRAIDDSIDNMGAYLTPYLADIEVHDARNFGLKQSEIDKCAVVEREVPDEDGKIVKKSFLKGARMRFYPQGMHIVLKSKGIKQPIKGTKDIKTLNEILGSKYVKTYESAVKIENEDDDFQSVVCKASYNLKRLNYQVSFDSYTPMLWGQTWTDADVQKDKEYKNIVANHDISVAEKKRKTAKQNQMELSPLEKEIKRLKTAYDGDRHMPWTDMQIVRIGEIAAWNLKSQTENLTGEEIANRECDIDVLSEERGLFSAANYDNINCDSGVLRINDTVEHEDFVEIVDDFDYAEDAQTTIGESDAV